jgi:hypothetical protein
MGSKLTKLMLSFFSFLSRKGVLGLSSIDRKLKAKNNFPYFYHCPNGQPENGITEKVKIDWLRFIYHTQLKLDDKLKNELNITFITYSNYQYKTLVEKSYEKFDITPIVLAKGIKSWNWMCKVKPVYDYISTLEDEDIIISTDANDIVLAKSPNGLLDTFKNFNCEILFCNTNANWPPDSDCNSFEEKVYGNSFHNHLSAGAYIGKVFFVKKILKEIIEAHDKGESWTTYKNKFDDQLSWRYMHMKYYPKIRVDTSKVIFCRYDEYRDRK